MAAAGGPATSAAAAPQPGNFFPSECRRKGSINQCERKVYPRRHRIQVRLLTRNTLGTHPIMASKPKPAAVVDEESAPVDNKKGKGGLPLKRIVIAAVAIAIVGGGGFGAFEFAFARRVAHDGAPAAKPAVFVDLPEVLVNLSNTGNDRTQYLRVRVVLELPDQLLMQQIQPVMPRVLDTFQTYLRELRPTDLDGSSGLYRLKEELTRRVNAAIAPNKVSAVLFKEIVVQ